MALMRICQQSVFDAVERVATGEHGPIQKSNFSGRNNARCISADRGLEQHLCGIHMNLIVRWRPGNDAVEVCRVPLRFHQPLTPPSGASVPKGKTLALAVIRREDGFRPFRGVVYRPICEVDYLLRMSS